MITFILSHPYTAGAIFYSAMILGSMFYIGLTCDEEDYDDE